MQSTAFNVDIGLGVVLSGL